ncbi:Macrocin O-methyltransferase [Oceanicola granulosus HTCC2516]|uniref:Macrocin O-methyltransferase n=1 Tax=Oceanicola granulosus (strain ATCC BAA-861 / DSM 15982 / KCTC 12143 / HTCC2516) TaxID=314256 RepID=Q2CBT7_OCEGH|nr:TylF/MycF/NovP-related O-methyltransferase [Oceanicola granulosus]EAR50117.1 Macrocin O-methyltransferase [Oceanicola granulosus HTCC2516]
MTDAPPLRGHTGGSWDRQAHETLYGHNLNTGLGDFIVEQVRPADFMEFGSGLCGLANYVAERLPLAPSYCIEPEIVSDVHPDLALLNVDVLAAPAPRVLDALFDMVLSIEVAEHVPRDRHEALFDFLVSRAGRLIVFSAARPGQGGHGHVSERPELEWRREFTDRGCRFDPALTMRARTMSNPRNINHRRNLQVFHAPERTPELLALERCARPYLQDLLTLVTRAGSGFTGNLFHVDLDGACGGRPDHSLHWKRENLRHLAARADHCLEIGFAAGHSALLCLLANPTLRMTIVDPLQFAHGRACFDYLAAMFPGRLDLVEGYSGDVLPTLPRGQYDLVHLDGGKDKTIESDLNMLRSLVREDHVLCIDDTQNPGLNAVVERWIAEGRLDTAGFEARIAASRQSRWTHCIARYGQAPEPQLDAILSRVGAQYREVDHPSIYTNDGGKPGRARAAYLVQAMHEVEARGLEGAFVEVGVAAGHSSVIAALAASRHFPRDFYLYDTFSGFAGDLPDEVDMHGVSIRDYDLAKYRQTPCTAAAVRARVEAAGQPSERLFLLEGPAEETIPRLVPPKIAVLRLDADLFDPTYAALRHMFDLVEPGGYVIVDDYGHWKGCAEAVDRFFAERGTVFPGEKIDYTCYGWRT